MVSPTLPLGTADKVILFTFLSEAATLASGYNFAEPLQVGNASVARTADKVISFPFLSGIISACSLETAASGLGGAPANHGFKLHHVFVCM